MKIPIPWPRDITVADVLTKTEGFAETGLGDFKMSGAVPSNERIWRWMLNRRVAYPPGTHFRYDGIGSDLLSVMLSKAIKQEPPISRNANCSIRCRSRITPGTRNSEGYLHGESRPASDRARHGEDRHPLSSHGRWGDTQIVFVTMCGIRPRGTMTAGRRSTPAMATNGGSAKTAMYFLPRGRTVSSSRVTPNRNLVLAFAADSIAGGAGGFVRDVVLPITAELPDSAPCVGASRTRRSRQLIQSTVIASRRVGAKAPATSLRAKRSNPEFAGEDWIASVCNDGSKRRLPFPATAS